MSRYPANPNSLIDSIRSMNALAETLREEGWTVNLKATETGARVWVEVSQSNACDPPAKEGERI